MKAKPLILCSVLSLTALMASGCYTVLSSPYRVADLHDEEPTRDVEAPTVGQFDDRDYMDDLYRYPGVRGGYGRYGGYYGGYGGYGGYHPHYYGDYPYYYGGYGPYSYGYDPYYRSSRGYYVSPGYRLISTRELDDLRAASRLNVTPAVVDPAAAAEIQRREENVWQRRVEPRVRSASPPPPRTTSSVSTGTSSPQTRASKASSAPASKTKTTTRKEKVAIPKKPKRRR